MWTIKIIKIGKNCDFTSKRWKIITNIVIWRKILKWCFWFIFLSKIVNFYFWIFYRFFVKTIWREFYFKIDEFTDFTSKSCKLTINIVIWGKIRDFQFWANFSMKWINLAIKRKIRNFYLKYFFDDFPSNGQSKLVKIDFTSKSWKS